MSILVLLLVPVDVQIQTTVASKQAAAWIHRTGLTRRDIDSIMSGEENLQEVVDIHLHNILDDRLDVSIVEAIEKNTPAMQGMLTQNPVQCTVYVYELNGRNDNDKVMPKEKGAFELECLGLSRGNCELLFWQ